QQDAFTDQEPAGGATPTPTPTATPGALQLRAQQKRIGGINTVRLNWRGATSPNVDIYRNDVLIATQPNDPSVYIDSTGDTGQAQYIYRVCEAGTSTCSNDVLVRFPQQGTTRPLVYQCGVRQVPDAAFALSTMPG